MRNSKRRSSLPLLGSDHRTALRGKCKRDHSWKAAVSPPMSGATASVRFYSKFDGFHFVCPFRQNVDSGAVHFFEVEYTTESGLPHSKQRAFNRDVINPQDGHILCD
jgi:hypothetical protein